MCGVFGIYAPGENAAGLAFSGLLALQHRGQESAGIATSDGEQISVHRGMGLVSQVFQEETIEKLRGDLAVGHVRYSTEGSSVLRNAQPTVLTSCFGGFALTHNGHLTNFGELKDRLLKDGHLFGAEVDSELIARKIGASPGGTLLKKIISGTSQIKGAFSFIILFRDKLYVVRDKWGIRPLVIGRIGKNSWMAASETVAIDSVGGEVVREVRPGEILSFSDRGMETLYQSEIVPGGFCIFEYVYFAGPASIINGKPVYMTRVRAGRFLAKESPIKADLVIGIPDSGRSAALGFSQQSGIPLLEGLIKNRYIGRTFINPNQRIRDLGVRQKLRPLPEIVKGKIVVLVDDSIVRGTTIKQIVNMLYEAGAKKVYVYVASPPFKYTCHLGVDVTKTGELIASGHSVEETCQAIGAHDLKYLSLEGLKQAVDPASQGFCTGCFDGNYSI